MELPLAELTNEELIKQYKKFKARFHLAYMGEKRKSLVTKYGYDTKNAAHLVRLMRMCVEFLETGVLNVYREKDGDIIRAIKAGKWTLDEVKAEAEKLFVDAETAKNLNPKNLPENVDKTWVDAIVVQCYFDMWGMIDESSLTCYY